MILKKKNKSKYIPPTILKRWSNDIEGGELYEASIMSNGKVLCTSGRHAHASGSSSVTWQGFLQGEMNELVNKNLGSNVLTEILEYLKSENT